MTLRMLWRRSDIGANQLVRARKTLGDEKVGDFDVLKEATSIEDSCCLPSDYFTPWDKIVIPIEIESMDTKYALQESKSIHHPADASVAGADSPPTFPVKHQRLVSVVAYLKKCNKDQNAVDPTHYKTSWLDAFDFNCIKATTEYLELLQRNVGHLILAPKCHQLAPPGACHYDGKPNPRSAPLDDDVCVARKAYVDGVEHVVDIPLVKKCTATTYWEDSCPDDILVDKSMTVMLQKNAYGNPQHNKEYKHDSPDAPVYTLKYERVRKEHSEYFKISAGLPSLSSTSQLNVAALGPGQLKDLLTSEIAMISDLDLCDNKQGLVHEADQYMAKVITADDIAAARVCPYGGLFEYCNLRQYASYLQKQLFDNDDCQVVDMRTAYEDKDQYYGTLACLYKITTLKCDCMEAVLNCYEHEYHFTEALTKTIGKAASILCGFILCQRPNVYSLFGGSEAIQKAQIMQSLLSQVGLASAHVSSLPPATFAFLSFGLGMIAFITTKTIAKKTMNSRSSSTVTVDDGYRNLI